MLVLVGLLSLSLLQAAFGWSKIDGAGIAEVENLRLVSPLQGSNVIVSDNIASGQVTQDKLSLSDPVNPSDAVTKSALETYFSEYTAPIVKGVTLNPTTSTVIVAVPTEIAELNVEYSVLISVQHAAYENRMAMLSPTRVCTRMTSSISITTYSSNTEAVVAESLHVIFVAPGIDSRAVTMETKSVVSDQDPLLLAPFPFDRVVFVQPISDTAVVSNRFLLSQDASHKSVQFYSFTTGADYTGDYSLTTFAEHSSSLYESRIVGSYISGGLPVDKVYFTQTYSTPPTVVLNIHDINRSGATNCILETVTTTYFTYNCFVYSNPSVNFMDRLFYIAVASS